MAKRSRRIVLKFGSGILSNPAGNGLDAKQFVRLGREVEIREEHLPRAEDARRVDAAVDRVRAGDRLSEGPVNPHDILRVLQPKIVECALKE